VNKNDVDNGVRIQDRYIIKHEQANIDKTLICKSVSYLLVQNTSILNITGIDVVILTNKLNIIIGMKINYNHEDGLIRGWR
jgi:hypothetical protein